jgi:hypothetical protein
MKASGIKVTVKLEVNGKAKTYQMNLTGEPVKSKSGKMTLAHFQPTSGNQVIKPFSKLYIDTAAIGKEKS